MSSKGATIRKTKRVKRNDFYLDDFDRISKPRIGKETREFIYNSGWDDNDADDYFDDDDDDDDSEDL